VTGNVQVASRVVVVRLLVIGIYPPMALHVPSYGDVPIERVGKIGALMA